MDTFDESIGTGATSGTGEPQRGLNRFLSREPPGPNTLKWLLAPIVVLMVMSNVAGWFFADLQARNPVLLISLSSINRHLIVVANRLDAVTYYGVGTIRLLVSDPLFFLIGYWYGDRALTWLDRRSPTYGPMIRKFEQVFGKAAWLLVLVMPNNWVCLLAGAAGMRLGTFFLVNFVGTIGRLYLIRVLGATFEAPIDNVTDFLSTYRWWIIGLSTPLFVWSMWNEFRGGGEVETLLHLDEIEPEPHDLGHHDAAVDTTDADAPPASWDPEPVAFADVTRRGTAHPPVGSRTPFDNRDFFDEAQLAELRAYARPVKRVRSAMKFIALAVDLTLIFVLDLGPKVKDLVSDAPWPLQLTVVVGVFLAIGQIVAMPASYWTTLVHDRRHGLSNQGVGLWTLDQVKEIVLALVLLPVLFVPIYWAIREFDSWWLIGGAAFLALQVVLAFAYPVLVMPRFNKFEPMPDGTVRRRIEQIADLAGVSIEGVYTMDGSKRSRRGNAFVAGFGKTKRVVVYDTVMDMPLDQLSQIIAHEIGHYRLNHIVKAFPFSALPLLVSLVFVQYVAGNETVLGWAGLDDLGDPAAIPVFLTAFTIPGMVFGLASSWLSRRYEREADLEALELLGDPSAFVAMWPALVDKNKADLEPGWWDRLNASHPEIGERMQFGLDWAAMNGVDVRRPERAAVTVAASADTTSLG